MNLIILGPPGAGKGTQGKRLHRSLGFPHISSGDIFREIRREDSPLAQEVRGYMDRGDYVPDALTIQLVRKRLAAQDAAQGFILDGFPRTEGQAEALDRAMSEFGKSLDAALYIKVPAEIVQERLQGRIVCSQCGEIYNLVSRPPEREGVCDVCGHLLERRTDESPDVIATRLETYTRETKPLVDYYRQQGIVLEVDGARPVDEVGAAIDAALQARV